jgi:hypothetical protein
MANNRELSQLASLVLVDDSTRNIGLSTQTGYVGIGTVNPRVKLDVIGDVLVSGVVTATRYYGDGSQLSGITAIGGGGGVYIQDEGTLVVGTAITTLKHCRG